MKIFFSQTRNGRIICFLLIELTYDIYFLLLKTIYLAEVFRDYITLLKSLFPINDRVQHSSRKL